MYGPMYTTAYPTPKFLYPLAALLSLPLIFLLLCVFMIENGIGYMMKTYY